jgi:hypothetical protein
MAVTGRAKLAHLTYLLELRHRTQAALSIVERLGQDSHARADLDHSAGLLQRRFIIDRGDRSPEPQRMQDHRGQHPWSGDVDRVTGLAEDLGCGVDSLKSLPTDQAVGAAFLGLDAIGDRSALRRQGHLAESSCLSARVAELAGLDRDLSLRDLP